MQVGDRLSELGYGQSPNFLRRSQAAFEAAPAFGHIFRLAEAKFEFQGVNVFGAGWWETLAWLARRSCISS